MRPTVPFLLVAGVVTAAVVGGGVVALGRDDDGPAPASTEETFSTTALADYDAAGAVVVRGAFCDDLDDRQVAAALGGEATDSSSWENGDTIDLGNGVEDVAHEFGCRYTSADGSVAQAWVFAPPVDAAGAQRLVKAAGKAARCQAGAGPAFGSPTLALTCTKGDRVRASYRGLFGDAWLVCEIERATSAGADPVDPAGRWCVGVLEAARG